jgi:hypothetical protein
VVERTYKDGLHIPVDDRGEAHCMSVIAKNGEGGVTWVRSYVSTDKSKSFCVYDAPTPEAIRQAADRNGLPVDRITEIRVLDPYFYK